jgi:DNA-binding MarR family transcriptional regulator
MGTNPSPAGKTTEKMIDAFWETVPPIWHIVRAHLHQLAVEQYGITVEQFHILRRIHFGHNTVSELADFKQISRSATSRTVDHLANKGLVNRLPDSGDRRRVILTLTAEGSTLLDRLFDSSRVWMAQKINMLDEEDIKAAIKGLETMREVFDVQDFHHAKHQPVQ